MVDYCIKCGAELRDGAEFCEECGKKIIKSGSKKTLAEIEKEIEEKVDAEFREKQEQEYRKRREKELWAEKERILQQEKAKQQAEKDAAERQRLEQINKAKQEQLEIEIRIKKQEQEQRQKRRQEQKEYLYSVLRKKKNQRILLVAVSIILIILIVPYTAMQIITMQENQRIADAAKRAAEKLREDEAAADQLWVKTYGGLESDYQDFGPSVGLTSDGGYILTGGSESLDGGGPNNALLFKTDANGTEQWNKTYGVSSFSAGFSVSQTKDEGYIIIGWTRAKTGNANAWLVKTDSNGYEQWNKTFGGLSDSFAFDGCQTLDGGYIITGNIGQNMILIKTDQNGNEQWNRTFGKGPSRSIQQTKDGGYIIVGRNTTIGGEYYTGDFLLGDIEKGGWLIKTDADGNKQWDRTFENETFLSVKQTSDGGYIIVGETRVWIDNNDNWRTEDLPLLIKTDDQGNKQWQTNNIGGITIIQTTDGGYIVAGGGQLIKTDSNGNKLWNKTYTYTGSLYIQTVLQTKDGGFILSGESTLNNDNNIFLLKTVGKQ